MNIDESDINNLCITMATKTVCIIMVVHDSLSVSSTPW